MVFNTYQNKSKKDRLLTRKIGELTIISKK